MRHVTNAELPGFADRRRASAFFLSIGSAHREQPHILIERFFEDAQDDLQTLHDPP
jgi:hypothetical protein